MQLRSLGKFFKIWYPPLVLMVIIFIFSSFQAADSDVQSGAIVNLIGTIFPNTKEVSSLVTFVRKTAHFLEYALLGYLTARALRLSNCSIWFAILICACYATSDEFHQSFVPGRSCQISDIILDTIGSTFGIALYALTHRKH